MPDDHPALRWLVYARDSERLPYRLYIQRESGRFLCYDVPDRWPGPGRSIFCVNRSEVAELPAEAEPVESAGIVALKPYGRKLTVVLDRPNRKRCWFITLERRYKNDPTRTYSQTFWITQSSARERRGGAYLSRTGKTSDLPIVRDSRERYGYRFPRHSVETEALPVGDYALKDESGAIVAVVERKTRDQFLHDIATFEVTRVRLLEMTSRYRRAALVIEATCADLVNPKKSRFYSAGLVAELLAELHTAFPALQVAYCTNRKFAAEWVERYFTRIARTDAAPETTADR